MFHTQKMRVDHQLILILKDVAIAPASSVNQECENYKVKWNGRVRNKTFLQNVISVIPYLARVMFFIYGFLPIDLLFPYYLRVPHKAENIFCFIIRILTQLYCSYFLKKGIRERMHMTWIHLLGLLYMYATKTCKHIFTSLKLCFDCKMHNRSYFKQRRKARTMKNI